jgi:flagellar biosynthesis/type III secretory pathway protein FliH
VIRYRYRTIQLNRLPWRRFVSQQNPVASALMSKMRIAERDRPRVKLECLRLLTTLKLDPVRMRLISGFVDTYLRLSAAENKRFERAISGSELIPEQKEQVMEIVTSWMETGIERGLAQGIERGMAQGRTLEAQSTLVRLGSKRFGAPDSSVAQRIEAAALTELESMIDRLLEAQSWQDVLAN